MITISDQEFTLFQRFIYDAAGINLSPSKKALVTGRLAKRLQVLQMNSYAQYFRLLAGGENPGETQAAIDLLTTNETYFFREPKHFDLLREQAHAASNRSESFRVWSAACSTGEEPYSIAMVLAAELSNTAFEIIGSDLSVRVLEKARSGHYPASRTTHTPQAYLQRFCLKGAGPQEGTVLVERSLRERVRFMQINLNKTLPKIGKFDLIFLRNVMIYFDVDTKRQVVDRVLSLLKPGGLFLIGHSESLNDITDRVQSVAPSIYRNP